jgi:hypothetical protein
MRSVFTQTGMNVKMFTTFLLPTHENVSREASQEMEKVAVPR